MRFTSAKLSNPKLFTRVDIPRPTDQEISNAVYAGTQRVNISRVDGKANVEFIAQWDALIDQLAHILKKRLNVDITNKADGDGYDTLLKRLKKGITDSIKNKDSGLMPNQADAVFMELKHYLEEVCCFS